jgi:large subunit ribosomal protein L10
MVAVAKALADAARETRVLAIRGGVMQGREIPASSVEDLAKLPPLDILRGQVLGAVVAPLSAFAALVRAPLQNLHGLIEARIEQLQAQGGGEAPAAPVAEPVSDTETVSDTSENAPETTEETTEETQEA